MSRGARRFSDPPQVTNDFRDRPTLLPPPPAAPDRSQAWFEVQLGWSRLSNEECRRVAELVLAMAEGRAS